MNYDKFLGAKSVEIEAEGFEVELKYLNDNLFGWQKPLVQWALRRGRAAIFGDTGLGKTILQSEWAWQIFQHTGNRVLIVAPLCVGPQTVKEASERLGYNFTFTQDPEDCYNGNTGVFVTNFESLLKFEKPIRECYFDGIVLDESSILKHEQGKIRTRIIELASKIPFRLSCTATPSPNDHMELGSQAEFLGIMSAQEMLAMFFTHDSGETSKWRLKGHGKTKFWEWLASWSLCFSRPSDLGFSDKGYKLPDLTIEETVILTGLTMPEGLDGLSHRNTARRETIDQRVKQTAAYVNTTKGPHLVWCNLNTESSQLAELISDSVEVSGADSLEQKAKKLQDFTDGKIRVLITKPKIAGFGMNWQFCNSMSFVGLNDSYEQLYQAIRRCYRFGQKKPVKVRIFSADIEGAVLENIRRKEQQAKEMKEAMICHMREFQSQNVKSSGREKTEYAPSKVLEFPQWIH